ncbi:MULTISPECIES: OmpA family protein [unclassified Avibacterium]|uniref:OmpA family protein n=1 Tax=unclassified Avibacterium TaxID=2685287 RepID=UPI0020265799|nr:MULTISPECIES: OmpA family protein [unclassified Avibacterium]MCW9699272.1 OmpA family protein [Avibacterium sp. 20-129]URL06561.1 OmpA family protein [Avibacterium sp. 21-595]
MRFKYQKLAWVLFPLALTGCSTQKLTWVDTKNVPYSNDVPEGRSSIVVYRQSDVIDGPTINVYINSEYLASLQPNAYRQETVCAENQKIYGEFTHQDPGYQAKEREGNFYDLAVNQVSFFKVANVNGRPTIIQVSEEQAKADLNGMPKQTHTLSRVDHLKECPKVLKKFNLEASALFKFDRSDYANMLPKGKQEIVAIAKEIKQMPDKIGDVTVIGYTDPEGNANYNQKLSVKRAETVKKALVSEGVNASFVKFEGRGESQPLVADCKVRYPKNTIARRACDQPNRRVSIVVHGDK